MAEVNDRLMERSPPPDTAGRSDASFTRESKACIVLHSPEWHAFRGFDLLMRVDGKCIYPNNIYQNKIPIT
jgi:hypothetical protein